MEFSALNVDFSSSSPNPLGSRRFPHMGISIKGHYFIAVGLSSACR